MNANLITKKIEMSKSEAKEAGKLNSEKFHELRQYMEMYPGYEIQIKAPAKHKVELRGLTYEYMRTYIQSPQRQRRIRRDSQERLSLHSSFFRGFFLLVLNDVSGLAFQ